MPTRKSFITAAAGVPLLAASPPSPSPSTSATSAAPTPAPKSKISPVAREFAARMRMYDPDLTDKQIQSIASGIDDNLKIGSRINPKGHAFKNWDEPATTFEAPE